MQVPTNKTKTPSVEDFNLHLDLELKKTYGKCVSVVPCYGAENLFTYEVNIKSNNFLSTTEETLKRICCVIKKNGLPNASEVPSNFDSPMPMKECVEIQFKVVFDPDLFKPEKETSQNLFKIQKPTKEEREKFATPIPRMDLNEREPILSSFSPSSPYNFPNSMSTPPSSPFQNPDSMIRNMVSDIDASLLSISQEEVENNEKRRSKEIEEYLRNGEASRKGEQKNRTIKSWDDVDDQWMSNPLFEEEEQTNAHPTPVNETVKVETVEEIEVKLIEDPAKLNYSDVEENDDEHKLGNTFTECGNEIAEIGNKIAELGYSDLGKRIASAGNKLVTVDNNKEATELKDDKVEELVAESNKDEPIATKKEKEEEEIDSSTKNEINLNIQSIPMTSSPFINITTQDSMGVETLEKVEVQPVKDLIKPNFDDLEQKFSELSKEMVELHNESSALKNDTFIPIKKEKEEEEFDSSTKNEINLNIVPIPIATSTTTSTTTSKPQGEGKIWPVNKREVTVSEKAPILSSTTTNNNVTNKNRVQSNNNETKSTGLNNINNNNNVNDNSKKTTKSTSTLRTSNRTTKSDKSGNNNQPRWFEWPLRAIGFVVSTIWYYTGGLVWRALQYLFSSKKS